MMPSQVGPIRKDGQVAGSGRGGLDLSLRWVKAAIGGLHLIAQGKEEGK